MRKKLVYIFTTIFSVVLGALLMYGVIHFYPNVVVDKVLEERISITDNGLAKSVEKVYDAVVVVESFNGNKGLGSGTGFVYKTEGNKAYIMTNHHVIAGATDVKVIFSNKKEVAVKVVGSDEFADIAVLEVNKKDIITVAKLGKSSEARLGDTVFTVGAPVGKEFSGTVTRGIVSGKDRMVSVSISGFRNDWIMNVMQTDAAINPGNSGGPLCNVNGEVIGINSMKIVQEAVDSLGFSIPIEDAIMYSDQLIKNKKITRPFVGIQMIDINSAYELMLSGIRVSPDIPDGVVIAGVSENSPASKAKLQKGDVIVKVDKNVIKSIAEFRYFLYKHAPGDEITFEFIRDSKLMTAKVKLEKSE